MRGGSGPRAIALSALAALAAVLPQHGARAQAGDDRIVFPASVQQGAMVIGKVPPGSQVEYAGRTLRSTGYGTVVFGVGRDQAGPAGACAAADGTCRKAERPMTAIHARAGATG